MSTGSAGSNTVQTISPLHELVTLTEAYTGRIRDCTTQCRISLDNALGGEPSSDKLAGEAPVESGDIHRLAARLREMGPRIADLEDQITRLAQLTG